MNLDLSEYMGAYIDGSRENLDTMDKMLLNLEQNPSNLDAVEEIFRAAHTLKGMSATMGFEKIAHLTHEMENILDKLRNKEIPVTTEVIDVIFETFDVLRTLVADSIESTDSNIDLTEISGKLTAIASGAPAAPAAQAPAAAEPQGGTEASAPAPAPAQNGGAGNIDISEFELSDFEISGLESAEDEGRQALLLKVALVSDCLLKGPRIFMVLRTLDDFHCDIVKSIPEVKDLENEKFDTSFKMVLVTDKSIDQIREGIESISEIETVEMVEISGSLGGAAPSAPPPAPVEAQPAAEEPVAPTPVHVPSAPPAAQPVAAAAPAVAPPPPAPPQDSGQGAPGEEGGEEEDDEAKEIIEMVQLVTFGMAGETYALEIHQVEAIINLVPITRVPKAPSHIDGVINLRGEIVPVINTRRRLRLPPLETSENNQIIILSFEEEKVKAGFMVDSVAEVIRLPETSIEPPTRVSESVDIDYLKGVGKVDNTIIILLNAHRIVFGKTAEE
ncbi:MAG: two-component system, chemotaxis family, sensor kinase CheA [Clostridiales bacterium]|nr:two-component system, chemotaxis family, sensor kinase CheA [Clostridiales bacterium]MDN5281352.1 two-component system, chemotaxis family, sensor kinase CheA [Candidatus Ozemobacter sp.]